MNPGDLTALLPLLIVAGASVLTMLAAAFLRNHSLACVLSFAGLATAFGLLVANWSDASRSVTPLLVMDPFARFFMGLILLAAMAVVLLSRGYFARQDDQAEEYYVLLLLATLGAAVLVASSHFASLFLGLELLSVSLYGLIAYRRGHAPGVEAGVKYLVPAGVSSAFLLFGMALVYARLGTMELGAMSDLLANAAASDPMLLAGLGLILVGLGFKLAVVPFHLWTPDVYQGAPAPVTAFVATVSKGAVFALLLRYSANLDLVSWKSLSVILSILAIASMIAGNLLALLQENVKRLLAYSSIAHLGYLLVALRVGANSATEAVAFYLAAYFAATLGAFGVVTVLSSGENDLQSLDDYRGLAWKRPWPAAVLMAALLSLAGIPLTVGFIGKFYLLAAGVGSALWPMVVVLVVTSSIGLFYYLRLVIAMYESKRQGGAPHPTNLTANVSGTATLAVLTVVLVWLGVYPTPLAALIRTALGQ